MSESTKLHTAQADPHACTQDEMNPVVSDHSSGQLAGARMANR